VAKKEINSNAKAKERHAAIAADRRKEESEMKNRLSENRSRNKAVVKKRREQIRELPKGERAAAKEDLRRSIDELKAQETAEKEEYKKVVSERKERERRSY